MEYRKLKYIAFRLILKRGGVIIKYSFSIIITAFLLVGCLADTRDSVIYEKLGVSKDEAIPESKLLSIEEMDNTTMRYTKVELADVGENAARASVADSFTRLNDHFSSGLMDVIDAEGNKYRAIYIGDYYHENFNAKNEYEKEVLEFYRTKEKTKEDELPYIEFKEMN